MVDPFSPMPMGRRSPRSLRHEYELYVEREIENYKDSLPRSSLLSIGDEAVSSLGSQHQLALTEVLLCEEVDRIIRSRLRLPAYHTWRRRRMKELEELRRPEHWGLRPDDPLVREVRPAADARVLVAGLRDSSSALFLAAHGCDVTALIAEADVVRDVIDAAEASGLSERIHTLLGRLSAWIPDDQPLHAVVITAEAFDGMSAAERSIALQTLQSATSDGGVHLVQARHPGHQMVSIEELRHRYAGWEVSVERGARAFLARKAVA